MNLIDKQLNTIRTQRRLGLMTHVVVGYPSLSETMKIVKLMEKAGVDFVELQIPFSDPLADGPTIMKASEQALSKGVKVQDAFNLAKELSQKVQIPLLIMAYFNNVFKFGTKRFCKNAKQAGISGLIVPDMPLEEEQNEHFVKYCNEFGLYAIRVISPASTDRRLEKNSRVAKGFVYFTARQGITGAKNSLDPNLINNLNRVRAKFEVPIAVGFGISKKNHIQAIKPYADIAILGSAIIDIINTSENYLKDIEYFIKELRKVL